MVENLEQTRSQHTSFLPGDSVETAENGGGARHRILHLIPNLGHGGGEHQLLLNVTLLDRDRFENHVCQMGSPGTLAPEFEKIGVPVHDVTTTGPLGWLRQIRKIRRLVKDLGIDLIHTTNSHAWMSGGIAGRTTGTPVLATLNNTAYEESWLVDNPHLNRLKLFYSKKRTELALKRFTTRYIAISQYVKQSHVDHMGLDPETIDVVYRGVQQEFFEPPTGDLDALRKELQLEDAFPVMLDVARLVPQKGQRYAIEALPEIVAQHPKAQLVLVGIGNREQYLRDLAVELDVHRHVTFTGPRMDVRDLHAISDIFLFPSVYEGFGSALGEALAAGNCCLVTGRPPMTEIVEHEKSGLHMAPQDPASIAEAVLRVAGDDSLRERLKAAARERARKHFTIEQSVADLEQVYSRITSAKTRTAEQTG